MAVSLAKYGEYRWLEMIPGGLIWGSFVLAVVLSFVAPLWAVIFIILFDTYWMFRVLYFVFYVTVSWRRYKRLSRKDWAQDVERIPGWRRIHHLVFLPMYGEDISIIRTTIKALRDCAYHNDRLLVVLAGEGREEKRFRLIQHQIEKEFRGVFGALWFTLHPDGLPDEIPGKGSNLNWAAGEVARHLATTLSDVPPEDLVVTSFDVDTVAPKHYFSYLTYLYLTVPHPTRASYQPLTFFSNNIWHAKAPVRVGAFGTTFWLMTELARPDRLWTFSSHSMSWRMLLDVGFWQKNIVSEDSRIFLQGLIHYDGDYRVVPMYIGVHMDAVTGSTYMESLKNLYIQQRRWAWGVENLMEMYKGFRAHPAMPFRTKMRYFWNQMEGMYTWATAPILIFLMGWLPLFIAGQNPSAVVQAAPATLEFIMRIATLGVFVSAIYSMTLLPGRPVGRGVFSWLVMLVQWALLPITFVIFGAFPSIDAQTRLMLGHYLGFHVTKKAR